MAMWSPWHGCKKISDGCKFCYIHKGDIKRNVDTSIIVKNGKSFYCPIEQNKNGKYKISSGNLVYLCFSSDFFIEEADDWRMECWEMIKKRSDLTFLFLTKRIMRFYECIPSDWGVGYDNVVIGCTICNQKEADEKLAYFQTLPIKHKNIICQPLLESINLQKYLDSIELLVVGGESDRCARILDFDWVKSLRNQCEIKRVNFEFRQCGSYFIKDGKMFQLQTKELCAQAKKANLNLYFENPTEIKENTESNKVGNNLD